MSVHWLPSSYSANSPQLIKQWSLCTTDHSAWDDQAGPPAARVGSEPSSDTHHLIEQNVRNHPPWNYYPAASQVSLRVGHPQSLLNQFTLNKVPSACRVAHYTMMMDIYTQLGVPANGFDSEPFVTSWILPTYLLAASRALLSVYCFSTIFYSFAWFAGHEVVFHLKDIDIPAITFIVGKEGIRQSFSYFTYLSYWGLAFYLFFASMHTFVFARTGHCWLDRWPRPLQAAHSVFYTTVVCCPFLVSSVYWVSMSVGWYKHDFNEWSMLSIHALNSVFAIFEIVFSQTRPPPWAHLGVLLLIMSTYLGVAYITKATEDVYIYLWLDPKVGWEKILAHVIGYAVVMVFYFNLVKGAIWLRCQITNKGIRNSSDNTGSRFSLPPDTMGPYRDMGKQEPSVTTDHTAELRRETWIDPNLDFRGFNSDELRELEPVHASFVRPRRASSFQSINYSRPSSQGTLFSREAAHTYLSYDTCLLRP